MQSGFIGILYFASKETHYSTLLSRRRHIGCASLSGRRPPLHTQGIDSLKTTPYLSTSNPDGVSLLKCLKVDFQLDTFYLDYLLINLCAC